MKKTVIVFVLMFALLAGLFAALPAMANPPGEQKVPIEATFKIASPRVIVENYTTNGNISHIIITQDWKIYLTIGDSLTPIEGMGSVYRDTDYRYKKQGGVDQVINDDYVFWFPNEGGGFEGYAHSLVTDYDAGPPVNYNIDVHVLLHGTGEFAGQTLNAWQNGPGTIPLWEGFLLKP